MEDATEELLQAVKGGDRNGKRPSDWEDRDGKRRKKDNEFCLEETSKVLMLGTGESGVANKIVGYVQDYFRLESLERIKQSKCVGEICLEFQKLVDANVADETFVLAVLKKLGALVNATAAGAESIRKLFQNDRLVLVIQSMKMRPKSGRVHIAASHLLLQLVFFSWHEHGSGLEGEEIDDIYRFLLSESCMMTVVAATENHRDNEDVVHCSLALWTCMGIFLRHWEASLISRPTPTPTPLVLQYLQKLEQTSVLPLCWYLLRKHITSNTKLVECALYILTQNVGGTDRPILKKLLAETPQVDEILSRVADIEGIDDRGGVLFDRALTELRKEYNLVRAQM